MKNNLLLSIISIFLVSCSIKNKVENDYVPILVDMDKNEVFLDSYKENVLILNLWATWCKPCIAEFESLVKSKSSYEGKKVKIVAISNEDHDKIIDFIDKRDIDLEFLKLNADLSYFNAYSLPTTIIFDKEGKEKFRITSGIDFTSKNFINKIIDIEKL